MPLHNILRSGLDPRFCRAGAHNTAGAAYGEGVYFAEDSGKADQYTTIDSRYSPGQREMHKRLYSDT